VPDALSPAPLPPVLRSTLQQALGSRHDDSRWVLGFSGGLDSTALLLALQAYRREQPHAPDLLALHVNHGLHADADAWAAHCQRLCARLQLPLLLRRVYPERSGQGPEAAARAARYAVFAGLLRRGDCLLLGHHLDDQIETFLLRLLRGAGPAALAGMPARRPLGDAQLLRPVLGLPRALLRDYVQACGVSWLDDPSNADTRIDRNYLRHTVMPLLEMRWPGYRGPAAAALADLAEQSAALQRLEPDPPGCSTLYGDPGLALPPLLLGSRPVAARALRQWLALQHCAMPGREQLLEFLAQLSAPADRAPSLRGAGWCLQRFGPGVFLLPAPLAQWQPPQHNLAFSAEDESLDLGAAGRVQLRRRAGVPGALARSSVWLCFRAGGERIRLHSGGASVALKQLLHSSGVPPWWRRCLPLLCDAQGVLAVGERWVAARSPWRLCWQRSPWPSASSGAAD